ncbi:MAG: beta-N-acetylhexosaminidase [Proteobacteria bacterium]|nr:beta-N-acetylhexosaminidase [Pseudomonadota bacterium]
MSSLENPSIKAVIFGCAGTKLSEAERRFFAESQPLGFILFQRNCREPAGTRRLIADLRDSVGRADAPILIDQEGGRVARLKPPHWRLPPSAARIGALGGDAARDAARINARLIAYDLHDLGVTINCAPVLDIPIPGAHDVIGDRAFGVDPRTTAGLGAAVCDGLMAGGILPVIKHMPGHGRTSVNSHHRLPVTDASLETLRATDFAPFAALSERPWAMTAHMVFSAVDAAPATLSAPLIERVIRGDMGFDGVLFTDDLSMEALGGALGERAAAALDAGCDVVEHCNGRLGEMRAVAAAVGPLSEAARARIDAGEALRAAPQAIDRAALAARLDELLG